MAEEEEIPQEEQPPEEVELEEGVKLPADAQMASDIFGREAIDGIRDCGVGTFQALEVIRRIVPRIPSSYVPRDCLFLIESVGTER
jgi:hypothetical protein